MSKYFFFLLFSLLCVVSFPSLAEKDPLVWDDKDHYDFSVHLGRMLPYAIRGVRSNYAFWGTSFSHPTSLTRLEYSFYSGRGEGVIWYTGSLSFRMDFKALDYLEGFFTFGADYHYYKRAPLLGREFPFYSTGGYHMGFGSFTPITDDIRIRFLVKFNSNPGKTLYIGLGLCFGFGGTNSEASAL